VAKRFSEGRRVAFFPAMGSWAEYVVVRYNSLLPVPDEIADQIAAQMLINTITASVLFKAGGISLNARTRLPVYILQNAAASAVGRLLTQVALDRGIRPIRLVRSDQSAERLQLFQRAIAIGKSRFANPLEDTSSGWLSMPSVEKRSTI
jgi:NADPH2:quinone reductase